MTEPPAEALLFDVPPPPTRVERLLHLADQYTQHNDALDLLLRTTVPSGPDAHADSALRLAADTQPAIKAIQGERLYESVELTETVMRLQQLAFLATASRDLHAGTARGLTALAPEAAVSCAVTLAAETRRRRWASAPVADRRLTAVQCDALAEIARGHVVAGSSLDREFTRSREPKVLMSTLRALEAKGLVERTVNSAHAAYIGGPPQDRVRLTAAGVTSLASVIELPPAGRASRPGRRPAPSRPPRRPPPEAADPTQEPPIPTPPTDLHEQARQLRQLARAFEALKARVHDVSYTPGTDALRRIGPLLLHAQDLTATAVVRLTALDNSAYTHVAGSRASLDLLSSVVSSSSLAGTDLAHVLLANPYEGAQFARYPADDEAVRAARHAEAIPKMSGHLNDAVHQLDLCATGCHYLAHGIAEDLASAQDHKPPAVQQTAGATLSPAQYDALTALAVGGNLYESSTRGLGITRVTTQDGTRVSIATYRALAKRSLVIADTGTSLFQGQKITVTEAGQRALAEPRPRAALSTAAATAPKVTVAAGVRR
ncbi:hypothetical protein [Streptomyces sp. NBC_00059]|uniref:hypothetical protein n=1 Tax=Streptomyces sp. NBC_00059 TaxID=2975635 RepID=UPI00224EBD1B|nr:hypothetical protein [Streptomyces sp. NBC_00059]MCX5410345.1 hypothetical protein [Streptomyces sp. NBC_00059]